MRRIVLALLLGWGAVAVAASRPHDPVDTSLAGAVRHVYETALRKGRALLAGQIVSPVLEPGVPFGGGSREVFFAPLNANGFSQTTGLPSLPAGFPSPTVIWTGADPTHNLANPAQTFTATGAPAAVGAPFCPSGDYDGIDEMDGRCDTARRFFGGNKIYQGGNYADINNGSLSVCALVSPNTATDGAIASQLNLGGSLGWTLYYNAAGSYTFRVFGDTPQNKIANGPYAAYLAYAMVCGTASVTSGLYAFVNGTAGTNATYPTGVTAGATILSIGRDSNKTDLTGDIAAVWIWTGTELTASQVKTFSQSVMGILASRGEQATFTSAANGACYWADGLISCDSSGMPVLGAEIPAGMVGVGAPSSGYLSHPSVTNTLLQSDTVTATWVNASATISTTTTNSPYRDGRAVSMVADTSAVQNQYVWTTMQGGIAALNVGDKITCSALLREDPAHTGSTAALYISEDTGGAGSFTATSPITLTSSWTMYYVTHTLTDTLDTRGIFAIYPYANGSGVAATGYLMFAGAACYLSTSYAPPIVCPTTTATATCGGDVLSYALSSPGAVLSATGTLVGTTRMSYDGNAFNPSVTLGLHALEISKDAAQRINFGLNQAGGGGNSLSYYRNPPGIITYAVGSSPLAGVWATVTLVQNFDRDVYSYSCSSCASGAGSFNSTTVANDSPTGLTAVRVNTNFAGTGQPPGGAVIKNVRVSK